MFTYEIFKVITNQYDGNPLRVLGHVKVFLDEEKTNLLTELPFQEIGVDQSRLTVSELTFTTKEEFDAAIETLVLPCLEQEQIQAKLNEVKLLKELGII